MEKKVINITNENYTQFVPLVPIAFSYAEGGAMGCPGQIVIIDNNSRIYCLNIYDFEEDVIKIIIPVLFECKFGMFGKDIPALEWHNFYLGMGNHLMVKDPIFDEFYPKAGEYDGEPGMLYQKWIDLVLEIISSRPKRINQKMKMELNTTQKIQLVGAIILMLCIVPMPYGFYTIVRVIITIISVYLAHTYQKQAKRELSISFITIAFIFQPFIKLVLGREIWLILDILVAVYLLVLAFKDIIISRKYKKSMAEKANTIQIPLFTNTEIEEVRDFALSGWTLGEIHGLSHWQRVERYGIILSMVNGQIRDDINIKVVRFFAYLHDKCRLNDWADLEHGVRAADMLVTIRNTILKDFTDEEISLLEKACRYHTTELRTGIPTVDVCFDADRLDLGRVGITPNPKLMASEQGAYYATNIHLLDPVISVP